MNDEAVGVLIVLLVLLVWFGLFATLGVVIAKSKGRSAAGWGVGMAFASLSPLIAIVLLIVLACLPNLKTEAAKQARIQRENRRLREQLRQEQIKTESFRQHASARLDAHDQHLGLDTRHTLPDNASAPAQLEAFGPTPGLTSESASLESSPGTASDSLSQLAGASDYEVAPPAAPQRPARPQRSWHYEQFGQAKGPIEEPRLIAMLQSGELDGQTLVWTDTMGDWQPADAVHELRPHVQF